MKEKVRVSPPYDARGLFVLCLPLPTIEILSFVNHLINQLLFPISRWNLKSVLLQLFSDTDIFGVSSSYLLSLLPLQILLGNIPPICVKS